ncbi:hypothetical protein GWK08_01200 [Leptobacterium flavescens]|uniref:TonB C-terminal domain-containing protein n=1 Tax=Leptobacterium flavescens TaxID=472055 RepID=A0A6P0UFK5_9FLAO|nr:hypothetical protein [Leptobacterium flavescens]NER12044.1 hypothetical protein [Leptobacterium flavescens]
MKKLKFSILCFLLLLGSVCLLRGQTLTGAWVKIKAERYDKDSDLPLNRVHKAYLRYEFSQGRKLLISSHYAFNASNSVPVDYKIENNIIKFGFDRQFLIEKVNDAELVLIEMEQGKLDSDSVRHIFITEESYLDRLPLDPGDKVVTGEDTTYIESAKLYLKFRTISPDFHAYLSDRINKDYYPGENYFFAVFTIHPQGEIDNIKILHHVSKKSDKKAIAAIKGSEGMWTLPKLKGEKVSIVKLIEDRYFKRRSNEVSKIDFNSLSPNASRKYPPEYLREFNLLARKWLSKDYDGVLKSVDALEKIKPDEPNLFYLRYLCYTEMGDDKKAGENLKLLKKSRLKYLIKEIETGEQP